MGEPNSDNHYLFVSALDGREIVVMSTTGFSSYSIEDLENYSTKRSGSGSEFTTGRIMYAQNICIQILLVGLDNAGKSSIFCQLKLELFLEQTPTTEPQSEKFRITKGPGKGARIEVWDIGGEERLRQEWRQFARRSSAIVFVVDSADRDRFEEARVELHDLQKNGGLMKDTVFVVLANKQDLHEASPPHEVAEHLDLDSLKCTSIRGCSALQGQGLNDFLTHIYLLAEHHKHKGRRKPMKMNRI